MVEHLRTLFSLSFFFPSGFYSMSGATPATVSPADYQHARDLVGYGGEYPHARWPGGAYIAINFVLNYEEGGENSVLHGDRQSEKFLSDMVGTAALEGQRCAQIESLYEYGSRAGFWRLARLFHKHSLPVTVFGVAAALAKNPAAVERMTQLGWEVATHGLRWIDYQTVPASVEAEHLSQAIALHTTAVGTPPVGYYIGRTSPHSAALCARSGQFLYDADSYADDLPYYTQPLLHTAEKDGRYQLVVPYTLDVNDMKFVALNGFTDSDQFFQYLKDQFDVLYEEGKEDGCPKMMSVGLHCRVVGKPARMRGLQKFIHYIAQKEHVWVTTRENIARHWVKTHPPPGEMFYKGKLE
ncbi:polysaccharide deacetylase [Angomonas deanei]|nr:polysaccharide deacetylase [Angomonas deanei]|eukprot:EPY21249.1 polysaccharide deacetylase [Angomonas deanei]